jgi:maltose-binding protein MalE
VEKGIESPEHKERLLAKFGNDPDFIRFASKVGSQFVESGAVIPVTVAPTPGDIQTKIDDIYASDAFMSKDKKIRQGAINKLSELHKQLKAGQPA